MVTVNYPTCRIQYSFCVYQPTKRMKQEQSKVSSEIVSRRCTFTLRGDDATTSTVIPHIGLVL